MVEMQSISTANHVHGRIGDEPTVREIEEAIKEIKVKLPQMNITKAISILYLRLQHQGQANQIFSLQQIQAQQVIGKAKSGLAPPQFQIREIISKSKSKTHKSQANEQLIKQKHANLQQTIENSLLRDTTSDKATSKLRKTKLDDNLQQCQQWDIDSPSKIFRLYASKLTPKFNSKEEEDRYFEKRLAARAYCSRGYGLSKVKEEFYSVSNSPYTAGIFYSTAGTPANHPPIQGLSQVATPSGYRCPDKKRYKTVSTGFVAEAMRRIQAFIMQSVDKAIRPFTGSQMRSLFSVLLNAQHSLPPEEYDVFCKFVKLTFDLGSISVQQRTVKRLYRSLQLFLKERTREESRGQGVSCKWKSEGVAQHF